MEPEPLKADPPKRKRRWYQFSLRTLLVFAVAVAIGCAWLGRKIEQKRRERTAADAIIKLHGSVYWDYERVTGKPGFWQPGAAQPFGPPWLRAMLGENFFSEVDHIVCVAGVENLKEFPHLRELRLFTWGVTDDGLETVKGLTELKDMGLIDTKISDAGVETLRAALPNCHIWALHQMMPTPAKPNDSKPRPPSI
jgi:hypothetical protein